MGDVANPATDGLVGTWTDVTRQDTVAHERPTPMSRDE